MSSVKIPYVVTFVQYDTVLSTAFGYGTMAGTLRAAWDAVKGDSCVEACIRRGGHLVAYLKTSWHGELAEAEVHARGVVTAINPRCKLFPHD